MKSRRKVTVRGLVLWLGLMLITLLPGTGGAIPQKINYQGYLTNPSGVPVSGTLQIVFSIYSVSSGGSSLWTETQNVTVAQGVYNVNLGDVTSINLPFDVPYYLGVRVGADPEMTPRVALTSVGYAFRAKTADAVAGSGSFTSPIVSSVTTGTAPLQVNSTTAVTNLNADFLDGLHASAFATSTHNHNAAYVNVDGDTMSGTLNVLIPSGGSHGVSSITASILVGAAAVEAKNTGAGYGLAAESVSRPAVSAYSDTSFGVYASTGATGEGKAAVRGVISAGSGGALPEREAAVLGDGHGLGTGVAGISYSGYGVWARSNGGDAIYAKSFDDSGLRAYGGWYGVYGETTSTEDDLGGVRGHASGASGEVHGIEGSCNSSNASCYAGYFFGRVHVTGSLTKGSGAFKIDHPLDPQNKYLYHSFVESPDMMNVYNGNVVLDSRGEAWVELPDWFEALNRDYRYQLTAIGGPGPNLHIAQKVQNNRFRIAGGAPGLEVSWQVTGIRHDPYAEAHRIPVEEDKTAKEKGTYLHPAAYGQPEKMGADYHSERVRERAPGRPPGRKP